MSVQKEELVQRIIENLSRCQRPAHFADWHKVGLSHAQVGMLYLLHYHPGASVKDAADHLGISKSAVTQLLAPLIDDRLVSRQADPADRRIARLELTAHGRKALKAVAKYKFAGLRSALGQLSERDLAQLDGLYKKLVDKL